MKNKIILAILILSMITLIFSGCDGGNFVTPPIPEPEVCNLPTYLISVKMGNSSESYFKIELKDVRSNYDIYDGIWVGWCADAEIYIETDEWYQGYIYCSYNPSDRYNIDWPKINWIINHKGSYSAEYIQDAIWHFTNGYAPNGLAMDAEAYPNFCPQVGQKYIAIIDVPGKQLNFIEVLLPPQGQITPGQMVSMWYDWPQLPVSGFYNFDVLLTIDVDPGTQSAYYWAHQFRFKNGDGGYMGLQTNGFMQGEWVGKMAIFSIWHALEAEPGPGASCEWFTGEDEGWSCRIKYNWVEGRTYCLRIWELCCAEKPEENEWWGAWIIDTSTSQETYIGKIEVPGSWQWLDDSSVVWVEYYGQVNDCASIPYAKARFEQPVADDGNLPPQKLPPEKGTTCTNAKFTPLENQGVIFETGGSL